MILTREILERFLERVKNEKSRQDIDYATRNAMIPAKYIGKAVPFVPEIEEHDDCWTPPDLLDMTNYDWTKTLAGRNENYV